MLINICIISRILFRNVCFHSSFLNTVGGTALLIPQLQTEPKESVICPLGRLRAGNKVTVREIHGNLRKGDGERRKGTHPVIQMQAV